MRSGQPPSRARHLLPGPVPILTVTRVRKPVAILLALLLLLNPTLPALAQDTADSTPPKGAQAGTVPPGQGDKPQGPQDTPAATRARTEADPPITTFTVDAFHTDLFTGAAIAEIPILPAPGTAGAAPRITLRYNSSTVDELGPREQGQGTGLGWTLDIGGFVLRDTKLTTSPNDDTFKLVFGGVSYDLILVDAGQNLYHTKDETFWRLQYDAQGDFWTLTTKDGTRHRFGFNPDSKAIALGQDLLTPVTYKYLLDEVTTTRGTAVRYAYVKQTATVASTGRSYDQAVYPDRITYTYHNGLLVGGTAREVRFLRAPRADWTDTSATTNVSFFERERLDTIEVLVGATLVRRYAFAFDYSIDRDPTYTWGGGATGDLTLISVTQVGADGTSTLPPLTFDYTGARLGSATNGIGGTVSYSYERVGTDPLYFGYKDYSRDTGCVYPALSTTTASFASQCRPSAPLGYMLNTSLSGTVPIYSGYRSRIEGACYDWIVRTTTSGFANLCGPSLHGYALSTSVSGTVPIYFGYRAYFDGGCLDPLVSTTMSSFDSRCRPSSPLGYIYVAKVDRYRVISRSVSDGRGGTSTTTHSYNGLGLSSDGKEFRGHAAVRAVDPQGHYTDTWFKQDDALKGRAYQVEARSSSGALYTQVVNTWSATNPSPGVTFVALSRADTYTCDGDATCKQAAQTLQYDGFGNPTQVQHLGDGAVTGDERTDVTEYAPNTTAYIVGLPSHALTRDAAGATVAETWFYYDGATTHTIPPTIGNLTRRCHWLNGGTNPCVTLAYDAFGNVAATTDARGNTTTTTYDTTFQTFPATVTTPPTPNVPGGLVTTSAYDARFGVVTSTTDPNNQTTTYAYDALGRLTSMTNALGHTSTTSYDAFGTVGSQRITTQLPDGSPDGLWSEAYFDGLGRTFQVRKEAAAGQVTVLETAFDSRGLVSQKSLPRFEGAAPAWTTFAYDPLGRPTTTTFPDGTTETTAYSDWTTTLTDRADRTRSNVKDAYGRITRITEPGGAATTYAYDPLGRLSGVTDAASNVTTIAYDTLGRKTGMTEPNMGTWAYAYDANGNLTGQTDAKGQTLTFAYDALNRLTTKTYPGGGTVSFTYDTGINGKGRRTGMTDLAGSAAYAYDALGRQISVTRVTDGVAYTTQTTYTPLGHPASMTYPDGEVVSYTYDAGGRAFSVAGAQTYVSSMTYDAAGQVSQVTFGNGVVTSRTYSSTTLRLITLVTSQGATSLQNLSYAYDNVGNITAITDNRTPSNNQSFAYDSLDRLTSATGPYGTETYSYNTIGNLLSKAGVSYTYGATGQTCNRLMPHAVTNTSDGKSYSYDCNGNLLTDGQRTLTWDADNKPVSITLGMGTTTFAYSGDGARVKKVGPTRAIRYAGAFEDHLTELAQVKHIFAGPLRVATQVTSGGPNAGVYFVHGDHLGSLNVLTNSSGAEVQRLAYRPWGETHTNTGTVDFDQRRFTGQEQDPETGLYFYQARYYHPELGRFLSPDPLVPEPGNPQSLNRYSYVENNPVNFTDPTGHFSFKDFFKAVVSIVVGVVVGLASGGLGAPAVLAGMVGGAAAGATGAALTGGNIVLGAGLGAIFGGIAGGIGPPIYGGFAGALGEGFGAAVATGASVGAVLGGLGTAIGGGNLLENIAYGATAGAVLAAIVYGGVKLWENIRSPALASTSDGSKASTANGNDVPDETAPRILLARKGPYYGPGEQDILIGSGGGRWSGGGTQQGLGNITQPGRVAPDAVLRGAERWLGDYREIAPGVFRSTDGLRQFRMAPLDLSPRGGVPPHVHFESINPATGRPVENLHVPLAP